MAPQNRHSKPRRDSALAAGLDMPVTLRDCANLVLVNEEIRFAFASQPDHAIIEVLDPTADRLAVAQFDCNRNLLLAQKAQIEALLSGLAWRRTLTPLSAWILEGHWVNCNQSLPTAE